MEETEPTRGEERACDSSACSRPGKGERACERRLRKRSAAHREREREREREKEGAQLEEISKWSRALHEKEKRAVATRRYTARTASRPRWRCPPEGGEEIGGEGERNRVAGYVNSRQHVQPRKSDLGGQCSPCKQAIVVRRRESIGSPLSLG